MPAHEQRLGELLRQQFPQAYVSLSHEILREFREYERTSTTALNSYVGPLVSRYLVSLEKMLGDAGFHGTFRVMQSNGGVMSAETAKKMPVTMMESGPVAGVIAAARLGEALGLPAYHFLRHGRHHGEVEFDQRLSSGSDQQLLRRRLRHRPSDDAAGRRYRRGRQRRRQHRLDRSRRRFESRAAERRRGAGSGLLWQRRRQSRR